MMNTPQIQTSMRSRNKSIHHAHPHRYDDYRHPPDNPHPHHHEYHLPPKKKNNTTNTPTDIPSSPVFLGSSFTLRPSTQSRGMVITPKEKHNHTTAGNHHHSHHHNNTSRSSMPRNNYRDWNETNYTHNTTYQQHGEGIAGPRPPHVIKRQRIGNSNTDTPPPRRETRSNTSARSSPPRLPHQQERRSVDDYGYYYYKQPQQQQPPYHHHTHPYDSNHPHHQSGYETVAAYTYWKTRCTALTYDLRQRNTALDDMAEDQRQLQYRVDELEEQLLRQSSWTKSTKSTSTTTAASTIGSAPPRPAPPMMVVEICENHQQVSTLLYFTDGEGLVEDDDLIEMDMDMDTGMDDDNALEEEDPFPAVDEEDRNDINVHRSSH